MSNRPVALAFVGSALLLGLGVPLSRSAAQAGVAPSAFAFWPTLVAGAVLATLAWRRQGRIDLDAKLVRFGLVSGVLGHALPLSASLWLAARAESDLLAAAFVLPPLATLLLSMLFGQVQANGRRGLALAVGLVAVAGILADGETSRSVGAAEAALVLLVPILIGSANVYRSAHRPAGVAPEWLGAKMLLCSAAALGALGLWRGELALPLAAGAILQLSLQTVALVAGYRFFFVLQRHAGPVAFSLVGYGMTLAGMAGTALLFDEHPSADALRAIALVAAALWFSAQTFETPAVRLCPPAAPLPAWNEAIDCTAGAGSCAPCAAA
jgi:drug/metabolite transporter (DMT)-like permease